MSTQKCNKCEEVKPWTSDFFHKNKNSLHKICKTCRNKTNKKWNQENPDYHSNYYKENHKKVRKQQNELAKINKDKKRNYDKSRREIINERNKERYQQDPVFRIQKIFRSRFRHFLEREITKTMTEYIGCSFDELVTHVENQWENWMNWENYGNPNGDHSKCWHIDHIIPLSSFDYSDGKLEQSMKTAWHYSNLRPLKGRENLSKGAKLKTVL